MKDTKLLKMDRWYRIDWFQVENYVRRIQYEIVVAYREKDSEKLIKLQTQLMNSFEGRASAVRKTTSTSGAKTAGIDKVLLIKSIDKWDAISKLRDYLQKPNTYKAKLVKRVMIPKPNGKERPLGIPVIMDRAMQNLVVLALDPIVEETSDLHSYGFRKFRNTGLAMTRIRHILDKSSLPRYIWDADIKGCFDNISYRAINNALKDKLCPEGINLINKWLNCGIIHKGKTTYPVKGVPQGGVISPVLMNLVLNGLEERVRGKNVSINKSTSQKEFNALAGTWIVRYADDFIVTHHNKEELNNIIIPKISKFLLNKGLRINEEKSNVIDLYENSFDFLGWTVTTPKRNWKLNKKGIKNTRTFVMKPSKDAVRRIKRKISEAFNAKHKMINIVKILNPIIRGWTNYYRISYHSQRAFQHITSYILMKFYKWGLRKHSTRGYKWLKRRYVIGTSTRKWAIGNSKEELMLVPNEATHWNLRTIKVELNPYTNVEYFIKKNIHLTADNLRKTVYIKWV